MIKLTFVVEESNSGAMGGAYLEDESATPLEKQFFSGVAASLVQETGPVAVLAKHAAAKYRGELKKDRGEQ